MDSKSEKKTSRSELPGMEVECWAVSPSRIHGQGIFARDLIPRGARLLEYVGQRISKAQSVRLCELQNEYIFSVSDEFDLDGNVDWNPARLLNHSCEPNCEALLEDERIWIVAMRDIPAGEELTFNYGYDLEDYRHYPCNCGAATCAGFMIAEEFFEHVRRRGKSVSGAKLEVVRPISGSPVESRLTGHGI